jgi:hypothetical protein
MARTETGPLKHARLDLTTAQAVATHQLGPRARTALHCTGWLTDWLAGWPTAAAPPGSARQIHLPHTASHSSWIQLCSPDPLLPAYCGCVRAHAYMWLSQGRASTTRRSGRPWLCWSRRRRQLPPRRRRRRLGRQRVAKLFVTSITRRRLSSHIIVILGLL